ncbi:hypothetical protein TWF225_002766 [Orbilia oligospora]|uniref:Uncharacterized protein n=1 Tax=Orbilia oligospora TaxID=2813651 RepID=A0A8H2DQG2_ORBOL|nr:hypothetical protein TWF225_002766 [Orbilia oligospora]KAF3238014.1 hypothetical protein TWF217_001808 [Orbilia oligospora]TGJ64897.1 hypothetical protein EYR41_008905 [Orbilia oligospora]
MANQKLRTIQDLNSKSAKYLDILTMWLVVIALGWGNAEHASMHSVYLVESTLLVIHVIEIFYPLQDSQT